MTEIPGELAPIAAVASWAGTRLTDRMVTQLERYGIWLRDEAIVAGGIGPAERDRIFARHVADSLSFSQPLASGSFATLVDLGSGVGLPGVPLAIAFPDVLVTLVERAGRRVDLVARAIRILALDNVEIRVADIDTLGDTWQVATIRAVLTTEEAIAVMRRVVEPGGLGVIGASRRLPPVEPPGGWPANVAVVSIPPDVLDSPAWLLTIRP